MVFVCSISWIGKSSTRLRNFCPKELVPAWLGVTVLLFVQNLYADDFFIFISVDVWPKRKQDLSIEHKLFRNYQESHDGDLLTFVSLLKKLSSDSFNLHRLPEKFLYPALSLLLLRLIRAPSSPFTFRRGVSRCNPVSYSRRHPRLPRQVRGFSTRRWFSADEELLCVTPPSDHRATESASRTLCSVFHFEFICEWEFIVAATVRSVFVAGFCFVSQIFLYGWSSFSLFVEKHVTGAEGKGLSLCFCTCHAAAVPPPSLCSVSGGKCSEVSLPVALCSVLDATRSYYWAHRLSESISCPLKTLSSVELAKSWMCSVCVCVCVCVCEAVKASRFITVTGRDVRGLIWFSYFSSVRWRWIKPAGRPGSDNISRTSAVKPSWHHSWFCIFFCEAVCVFS